MVQSQLFSLDANTLTRVVDVLSDDKAVFENKVDKFDPKLDEDIVEGLLRESVRILFE